MPTVRLTETATRGVYQGSNGCLYEREDGVERRCSRCGRWAHTTYRWAERNLCDRHLRVVTWAVVRVTTTFAFRPLPAAVYGDQPPARVLRWGDTVVVGGIPTRVGRFDRFPLTTGGFVLVPWSRWAWA